MRNGDLAGRILGGVVFLAGVGILVFVFVLAYGFFTAEDAGIQLPTQGAAPNASAPPVTTQLGTSALIVLIRIALLIVMAVVGSLLAGRGIQLYFGAGGDRRVSPKNE